MLFRVLVSPGSSPFFEYGWFCTFILEQPSEQSPTTNPGTSGNLTNSGKAVTLPGIKPSFVLLRTRWEQNPGPDEPANWIVYRE